jgi:hypothetical protein
MVRFAWTRNPRVVQLTAWRPLVKKRDRTQILRSTEVVASDRHIAATIVSDSLGTLSDSMLADQSCWCRSTLCQRGH